MTAIAYRKPARPLEILIRTTNGIFLSVPVDTYGVRDKPKMGREVRKLLREVIAFSKAKKK
ncbi:MAG: hypothetical protein WDO17_12805 [Alphaproteobacteria bacterium]